MASTRGLLRAGRKISELAGTQQTRATDRNLTFARVQDLLPPQLTQQIRSRSTVTIQGNDNRVAAVTKSLLVDTLDLVRLASYNLSTICPCLQTMWLGILAVCTTLGCRLDHNSQIIQLSSFMHQSQAHWVTVYLHGLACHSCCIAHHQLCPCLIASGLCQTAAR